MRGAPRRPPPPPEPTREPGEPRETAGPARLPPASHVPAAASVVPRPGRQSGGPQRAAESGAAGAGRGARSSCPGLAPRRRRGSTRSLALRRSVSIGPSASASAPRSTPPSPAAAATSSSLPCGFYIRLLSLLSRGKGGVRPFWPPLRECGARDGPSRARLRGRAALISSPHPELVTGAAARRARRQGCAAGRGSHAGGASWGVPRGLLTSSPLLRPTLKGPLLDPTPLRGWSAIVVYCALTRPGCDSPVPGSAEGPVPTQGGRRRAEISLGLGHNGSPPPRRELGAGEERGKRGRG